MLLKSNGTDYKPIPPGTYPAVCTRVIDLGTQTSNFQGQEKSARKIMISWEVPEVVVEIDGEHKPAMISNTYTASLHEKAALRAMLKSWRGRDFTADELQGFDTKNILGAACMLAVVHSEKDGNTYANVSAVMGLPKGMEKPKPFSGLTNLDLDNFDEVVFDGLSDKLREKIRLAPEFKKLTDPDYDESYSGAARSSDPFDDDIPF